MRRPRLLRRAPFVVLDADSRAGRRRVAELEGRGAAILDERLMRRAAKLVAEVRDGGDRALVALARRFDGSTAKTALELVVMRRDPSDRGAATAAAEPAGRASGAVSAARAKHAGGTSAESARRQQTAGPTDADLPAGFAEALERAIAAVERFHAPQMRQGYRLTSEEGLDLEERVLPLDRVGIYVPGGRASYPSTVVMTVTPARLAGVREIVVATPPAAYAGSAALRYTLRRLGVDEVWGVGGAHAVAALAYGTQTLRRVDKIVGPGNAWVTAAKRLVAGEVAIDGLAGPSEVLILADDTGEATPGGAGGGLENGGAGAGEGGSGGGTGSGGRGPQNGEADAATLAADLLAQAEHDPLAVALLVTTSRRLAKRVAAAAETQLVALEGAGHGASAATARASLRRFGAALVVRDWEAGLELAERLAPEHLQLVGAGAEALADRVRSAGAVFVGAATPEVFGDYIAGPSHVLPTCGSARFASALGVEDFLRRTHTVRFSAAAAARWAAAAACLADAEGLPAHAAAARRRLS